MDCCKTLHRFAVATLPYLSDHMVHLKIHSSQTFRKCGLFDMLLSLGSFNFGGKHVFRTFLKKAFRYSGNIQQKTKVASSVNGKASDLPTLKYLLPLF